MLISKSLWLNIQIILESWEFNYTCINTNVSSEIGKKPCAKVLSDFFVATEFGFVHHFCKNAEFSAIVCGIRKKICAFCAKVWFRCLCI